LVVEGRQNPVEKLVLIEVALESAEAIGSAVEKDGQIVGVLQRGLVFVDFEPQTR